jgi:acyl transferase domain-containing protein
MKMKINPCIIFSLLPTNAMAFQALKSYRREATRFMMSDANSVSYKVGFMFPGQGAQVVGMAGNICKELPAAKGFISLIAMFD